MLKNSSLDLIITNLPLLLKGVLLSLQAAVGAVFIGMGLGFILGILNSDKVKVKGISKLIDLYVLIIRGTPLYVQILIFYYALPDILGINMSPFVAGVLALGCNSVAYVSEVVRGGINAVDKEQWDACYVLGYSFWGTLVYVVLPQMLKNSMPILTNEVTVSLKDTSILSVIGLAELSRIGMNINARMLQPMPIYLTIAFLYFVMTSTVTFVSKKIERGLGYDNW